MLGKEFDFVDALKAQQQHSWTYITKRYNEVFGVNLRPDTLQKRYTRELAHREVIGGSLVDKAVAIIKSEPIKPTELARRLSLDLEGLEDLLDDLLNCRAAITFHNDSLVFDRTYTTPDNKQHKMLKSLDAGVWHKIGILADTHYCSVNEMPHLVEQFYHICQEEGVVAMIHAGDVSCGIGNVYKGQIMDIKITGIDKQLQYIKNVYPMYPFPTYMISGNHDMDAFKSVGVDLIERLCEIREDLTYLGKLGGYIDIDGVNIYVLHGDAGSPAARTFKLQKLIDNMPADVLPDVLCLGHYHTVAFLPHYRGVLGIMPASFESKSEFLTRKGLYPELGGVILNIMVAEVKGIKKVVRSQMEFINLTDYA